jgi:hypothetical protein
MQRLVDARVARRLDEAPAAPRALAQRVRAAGNAGRSGMTFT